MEKFMQEKKGKCKKLLAGVAHGTYLTQVLRVGNFQELVAYGNEEYPKEETNDKKMGLGTGRMILKST